MKRALLHLIILVIVLFLGVSNGLAASKSDGKIYSGLGCTEIPNGVIIPTIDNFDYDNDVLYTSLGWAYNSNTTDTIVVACPVVREFTLNPLQAVHVSFLNETDQDAFCEVESFDTLGNLIDQSNPFKFPANNFGGFPLTISKSNEGVDDSYLGLEQTNAGGFHQLVCFLPPGVIDSSSVLTQLAFIVSYQIDEAVK